MTDAQQTILLQLAETLISSGWKAILAAHDGNADTAKMTLAQQVAHLTEQPPAIETTLAADDAVADNAAATKFAKVTP